MPGPWENKLRGLIPAHQAIIPAEGRYTEDQYKYLYSRLEIKHRAEITDLWQLDALLGILPPNLLDLIQIKDKWGANVLHYLAWSGNKEALEQACNLAQLPDLKLLDDEGRTVAEFSIVG